MIVKMKKVAVLVQQKDSYACVEALKQLGVVHVEHARKPESRDIALLEEDIALIEQAESVLASVGPVKEGLGKPGELEDWRELARHIIDLKKRYDHLKEYSLTLRTQIDEWSRWGDFEPQDLSELKNRGVFIGLYRVPKNKLTSLPEGVALRRIAPDGDMMNCALVSLNPISLPFKQLELPHLSLAMMKERFLKDGALMQEIGQDIAKHSCFYGQFLDIKEKLNKELEFNQALAGMGAEDNISYILGFIPQDEQDKLVEAARREKWAVRISEPGPDDPVPTLLRNPKWAALMQPVLKLLSLLPGYSEWDISPLFLLFLGLFFGMIIGDAGYGTVYMLLTFLVHSKLKKRSPDPKIFSLFYFFSGCAIIWGLLTGTFFGQDWVLNSGFQPLVPALNNMKFLEAFCFFVGALHLTLGHLWQGVRKAPSPGALVDAGWICVLWAAFFLAKALILDDPFPNFAKWLAIAGISLVVLFSSPQKNIFKMLGTGLGTVALSLVNNFTDVVSYVRLFAVGLAGLAIADTANMLASGVKSSNTFAFLLILCIGHTINIVLGPLSVLVHGVRLNVLEFSSHANLTWSGIDYKPLKG